MPFEPVPRRQSRTVDPFKVTVLPPIDSHLLNIMEEKGRQAAVISNLEKHVTDLQESIKEAETNVDVMNLQIHQQFATINKELGDIKELLKSGTLEEDKLRKKHRREMVMGILAFLTTIGGIFSLYLKNFYH